MCSHFSLNLPVIEQFADPRFANQAQRTAAETDSRSWIVNWFVSSRLACLALTCRLEISLLLSSEGDGEDLGRLIVWSKSDRKLLERRRLPSFRNHIPTFSDLFCEIFICTKLKRLLITCFLKISSEIFIWQLPVCVVCLMLWFLLCPTDHQAVTGHGCHTEPARRPSARDSRDTLQGLQKPHFHHTAHSCTLTFTMFTHSDWLQRETKKI